MTLPERCPTCAALLEAGARFCGGCGAPVSTPAPEPVAPDRSFADTMVGRVLNGRYRVVRKIGQGGFGTVYEGVQLHVDRPVALKVLHPRMTADPQLAARFRREARAACNLRDAHTIVTYDFEQTEEGTLFLVMELLAGRSLLQELAAQKTIAPPRAAFLCDQVCSALAEAHSRGIVHRDIKPENIFLEDRESQRDYVKVLDFGIAKIVAGEPGTPGATARLTASGQTLGTLEYMSPEQLAGSDLDGRSDVYSLGITLYQMLTGKLPFSGTPTAVIAAHLHQQAPPPSKHNPAVPPAFDALVLRCLAKDRAQRQPDMPAMRAELAELEARPTSASAAAPAVEIPATRIAASEVAAQAAPAQRRVNRVALAITIILIVLGVLGGIGVATYLYFDSSGTGGGSGSGSGEAGACLDSPRSAPPWPAWCSASRPAWEASPSSTPTAPRT
jgi:eukaryotic-like serine/threonine-protein kinase